MRLCDAFKLFFALIVRIQAYIHTQPACDYAHVYARMYTYIRHAYTHFSHIQSAQACLRLHWRQLRIFDARMYIYIRHAYTHFSHTQSAQACLRLHWRQLWIVAWPCYANR